jgi:hypothetical protein
MSTDSVSSSSSIRAAGVAGVYNRSSYGTEKRDALMLWSNKMVALVGRESDNAQAFGEKKQEFGTGYSSLDYLRRYPSNRIKIAQNFVTKLETTPGDAAIIRATIGLAPELNIDVIAEGVESQVQCDLLKELGCGEVQGFLFARPLTAEDAAVALRDGKILPPRAGAVEAGKV